ncbi:MAG: hypothetical protein L0271_13445 [Gemmatimonadetes bacterium]|nr:hypothetical protein [Gemmatimonadota bacterium]
MAAVASAATCITERERPSPVETAAASLSVRIVQPRHGATVLAGTSIAVVIEARDLDGSHLTGLGYVSRRLGSGSNATVDSVALRFPERSDSTHGFTFDIPAALPTNTQLDVYGIAYGPGSQARVSVPVSVVVARLSESDVGVATPTRSSRAASSLRRRSRD